MIEPVGVLFVCTGNICRSPTAEGVFTRMVADAGLADRIRIDSAATHNYHPGEPPDQRSQQAAARRGYDLSMQRARLIRRQDFVEFQHVLAMDVGHMRILGRQCPPAHRERLRLFMQFAPHLQEDEVPDPYYGHGDGFELVLDMVEAASEGLLEHIRSGFLQRP